MTDIAPASQLLVLPRGIEPIGSQYPGTVQYDSPESGDTFDRAVTAARYVLAHQKDDIDRVVFVSHETFTVPRRKRCSSSEAEEAAKIAVDNGLDPDLIVIRNKSRSTVGGCVEAVSVIDPRRTLGVIVQKNHAERSLNLGRLVLPTTPLVAILADNPERTALNKEVPRNDVFAELAYDAILWRVKPGNVAAIHRRDIALQKLLAPAVFAKGLIS